MTLILLINPNTARATTAMMVAIARAAAPAGTEIAGVTADRGPAMIVDPDSLAASANGVVAMGLRLGATAAGIVVAAFGDPGLDRLRAQIAAPVVGIAEAAMLEAAAGARRFGIATVTPLLAGPIAQRAADLGLSHLFSGTRLTPGDPVALAADPNRLIAALHEAVVRCIEDDGAEAVAIGGGPLGNAATALAPRFAVPVIAPIPAAVRLILARLRGGGTSADPP